MLLFRLLGCSQVPWLVIFGVLTLVPQTAVCYYLMLAAWVSGPVLLTSAASIYPGDICNAAVSAVRTSCPGGSIKSV